MHSADLQDYNLLVTLAPGSNTNYLQRIPNYSNSLMLNNNTMRIGQDPQQKPQATIVRRSRGAAIYFPRGSLLSPQVTTYKGENIFFTSSSPMPPNIPQTPAKKGKEIFWRRSSSAETVVSFPPSIHTAEEMVVYVMKCVQHELQTTRENIEEFYIVSLERVLSRYAKDNSSILASFLESYQTLQRMNPHKQHHAPILELLTTILSLACTDVEIQVCTRLLAVFAQFEHNLPLLDSLGVPPLLLGCLTCHSVSERVRCSCLRVLTKIATLVKNPGWHKSALKESSVDILAKNLQENPDSQDMVVLIIETLANMCATSFSCCQCLLRDKDLPPEVRQVGLQSHLAVLQRVEQDLLPLVEAALNRHPHQMCIQIEGHRLLHFYSEEEQRLLRFRSVYEANQSLKPVSILKGTVPDGDKLQKLEASSPPTSSEEAPAEPTVTETPTRRVRFHDDIVSDTFHYLREAAALKLALSPSGSHQEDEESEEDDDEVETGTEASSLIPADSWGPATSGTEESDTAVEQNESTSTAME